TAQTMTCMPADAHALARLPVADVGAKSINNPDDFMPRNSWILNPRKDSFLNNRVAVTDATGLDFNSDGSRHRFRDFPFREFQRTLPASDLNDAHLRHVNLLSPFLLCLQKRERGTRLWQLADFSAPNKTGRV